MAVFAFTASIDLTTRGKRLASWHLSQGTGAQTINFRSGSVGGTIIFQVQLVATSSASQSYSHPNLPAIPGGLYIEVVGTGLNAGSVDLV